MEPSKTQHPVVTQDIVRPWTVLNVDGRDPALDFALVGVDPNPSVHPPVNYHAYAACTGGSFQKSVAAVSPATKDVLVLLRKRNLVAAKAAVRHLQERSISAWVSLKESGALQASELISDARRWQEFCDVCTLATGCISSTPDLVPLYESAGSQRVKFIPTPYPVDLPAWDFTQPVTARSGIFVGTREFDVWSRRHALALTTACTAAKAIHGRVMVINPDGRGGHKILEAIRNSMGIGSLLEVVDGPLPYPDYLRLMASCRLVWQLDASVVPGQVAGDALLARIPCVGGNGAIDRLGHPDTHGDGRDSIVLRDLMMRLLSDDAYYSHVCEASQMAAHQRLSFGVVANQLQLLSTSVK